MGLVWLKCTDVGNITTAQQRASWRIAQLVIIAADGFGLADARVGSLCRASWRGYRLAWAPAQSQLPQLHGPTS